MNRAAVTQDWNWTTSEVREGVLMVNLQVAINRRQQVLWLEWTLGRVFRFRSRCPDDLPPTNSATRNQG